MILGLRWYGPVGVLVFAVSAILMLLRVNPFYSHFYDFAWYGYICLADSLVYRWRRQSLLSNRFGEFLLMLPLSWLVWEVFEGFNLRLNNWHYVKIVNHDQILYPFAVWKGPLYFIAFATVLPGLFETLELIRIWSERRWSILERATTQPWVMTRRRSDSFMILGVLCVALPMFQPLHCFPLIWFSMFLILDPINYWAGRPSILRELSKGNATLFCQILLTGMICGGFWELWNFWAGIKWVYNIPWPFDQIKIFEMPCLGLFGFPPFALECYAMYHFLRGLPGVRRLAKERSLFAIESPEGEIAVEDLDL